MRLCLKISANINPKRAANVVCTITKSMRRLQAQQRKNVLGEYQGPRSSKRARRRAFNKLLAKRQATEKRACRAPEPIQAIYDSGSESCPDVQDKTTEVGSGDGRGDGEVLEPETERQADKEGGTELARGGVQSPKQAGIGNAQRTRSSGEQETVEHKRSVPLPAISYCSIL